MWPIMLLGGDPIGEALNPLYNCCCYCCCEGGEGQFVAPRPIPPRLGALVLCPAPFAAGGLNGLKPWVTVYCTAGGLGCGLALWASCGEFPATEPLGNALLLSGADDGR